MAGSKTIVASSASDSLYNLNAVYATAHNAATGSSPSAHTLYVMQSTAYQIIRTFLILDTSDIPAGASILFAIIQIKPTSIEDAKTWNIVVRDGQPTYPHNPVVTGDYLYSHYSDDGGSVAVSSLSTGSWNNIILNATGRGWIQQGAGAVTKLALISSKDISSTAPTALERVTFTKANVRIVITYSVAPTVTVQAPDVNPTTATANGNITDTGGENCTVRGFKYGLTETDTWDEHDNGDFGTGAYTKALTGLSPNTTYFIQAYATNPQGTVYSAWYEFQTAATGATPTGSFLNICSDHSGYTYQEHGAETDDGDEYTGFFVLSTDLMEKQGLSILKWIQDLYLYFRKEDSGSMDIYIKEDNEANWQSAGSVLLTGDEDIIIKHLPIDFQAKHYLIKISGANAFRFIGAIINHISIEGR